MNLSNYKINYKNGLGETGGLSTGRVTVINSTKVGALHRPPTDLAHTFSRPKHGKEECQNFGLRFK